MATKLNFTMDQGSDFSMAFDMTDDDGSPIDLTVYTGASQMRKHYTSTNATSFSVSLSSNGTITLSLPTAQTALMDPGRYLYDVELTDSSNNVFRVVEGIVTVTPNITR